jgi:hypothetical protein
MVVFVNLPIFGPCNTVKGLGIDWLVATVEGVVWFVPGKRLMYAMIAAEPRHLPMEADSEPTLDQELLRVHQNVQMRRDREVDWVERALDELVGEALAIPPPQKPFEDIPSGDLTSLQSLGLSLELSLPGMVDASEDQCNVALSASTTDLAGNQHDAEARETVLAECDEEAADVWVEEMCVVAEKAGGRTAAVMGCGGASLAGLKPMQEDNWLESETKLGDYTPSSTVSGENKRSRGLGLAKRGD